MRDQDESATALAKVDGSVVARRWLVSLRPDAALAAVERECVERAPEAESPTSRMSNPTGKAFVSRTGEGGLVLWRRPDRDWTALARGVAEPVPYPQMLHLEAKEIVDGSEIVATWRPHPATRKSRTWFWVGVVAMLVMSAYCVSAGIWWALPLFVASWLPSAARHLRLREAKMSLLVSANAPLARHELGAADVDASAFRAAHARDSD